MSITRNLLRWPSLAKEPLKILFSDKGLCVVDKPAGLVAQAGVDVAAQEALAEKQWHKETTMEDHFEDLRTRLDLSEDHQIRTVHRLDKQTTGPLILALNQAKAKDLANQFKAKTVEKSYVALVSRYMYPDERIVVPKNHKSWLRTDNGRVSIARSGEENAAEVETRWEWLGGNVDLNVSLIRMFPITGHKHQLRVFASHYLSAPVVGDGRYQFNDLSNTNNVHPIFNRKAFFVLPPDSLFLHCESITFNRYVRSTGKQIRQTVHSEIDYNWKRNLGLLSERVDPKDEIWSRSFNPRGSPSPTPSVQEGDP
ncbi:RNA pseudouridylate synthases [Phaffia rhodozyma]|uniref:21S rRNA pseudouridine(2819) synthase n=1 Tax=Phaffia rhodozyma TaxID=264483 RepID=A0A0F7SV01_PHARH|nr:RNA pseudouridylate synthases [Phaffia rhodozyma]